jgi:hypothetical protein
MDRTLKRTIRPLIYGGLFCFIALTLTYFLIDPPFMQKLRGRATVSNRLAQFGPAAQERWAPFFEKSQLTYPPTRLVLVGLKQEELLQVYAADATEKLHLVRTLPVQKSSGKLGPKLREGDYQVPEGLYRIESLNPNSAFHLSLRINYPNNFDRKQAEKEGRTNLGGNIMIHGSNASVGCLAMGDDAAEDLFILAAETGIENIDVILSPVDFRERSVPKDAERPQWVSELYTEIKKAMLALPRE